MNDGIKELLVARATGNLSDDARIALDAALAEDGALRSELESIERTLAAVRAQLPDASPIDIRQLKDRLQFRIQSEPKPAARAVSRRAFPRLISRGGFYGFHWRWNWVPYAVSVCAVSLVLFSLHWIVVEGRSASPDRPLTASRTPDDRWMPIRYSPDDRSTVERLNGRTIKIADISGAAVVVGERLGGAPIAYLQCYSAAAFDRVAAMRGASWRQSVDSAAVRIENGALTLPESLFDRYIASMGPATTVRLVAVGDPAMDGFIEIWNPNAYIQYQADSLPGLTCQADRRDGDQSF